MTKEKIRSWLIRKLGGEIYIPVEKIVYQPVQPRKVASRKIIPGYEQQFPSFVDFAKRRAAEDMIEFLIDAQYITFFEERNKDTKDLIITASVYVVNEKELME